MKRILLYAGAGLLTFLGFIIFFAPASLLYGTVTNELNKAVPGLQLVSLSDTIWNGRAQLRYRNFPNSELVWNLAKAPLMFAKASADLTLNGEGHKLEAYLDLDNSATHLDNLEGTITSNYVNQESRNLGLTFTGELQLLDISLSADRGWLTGISGKLHWTGGRIHYAPDKSAGVPGQVFELPPLDGALSLDDKVLVLDIIHEGANLALVRLRPDGWAEIIVKARLFDLAGVPWPAGSSLDDTVLQLEQQLFPGRG